MRLTTILSQEPSIIVIQGAYEQFVVPVTNDYDLIQVRVFAIDTEAWLKFQCLLAEWHVQRGATSSITEAASCPAYQSIVGMGKEVLPFIFAQLESEGDEPDQWFWALKAITRTDPVRDEDRGDFVAMARTWLAWAKSEGYAW